jgi:hypothetical protein
LVKVGRPVAAFDKKEEAVDEAKIYSTGSGCTVHAYGMRPGAYAFGGSAGAFSFPEIRDVHSF